MLCRMQETIIVIPCYNEALRLPVEEFKQNFELYPNVLFLFVNDGSTDTTFQLLQSFEKDFKNVKAIDKTPNGGKAKAVQYAVNYAIENYSFKYIGYFDADLATPLFEIKRFLDFFAENSKLKVVVGSRVRRLGANIERNWKRHLVGRVFATFASSTLLLPVYDTQCGAKIFERELAKNIFKEEFISKWLFDVELFARITLFIGYLEAKEAIYEHPLEFWFEKGDSRIKSKDFFKLPIDLFKIYRKYHRKLKKNKQNIH